MKSPPEGVPQVLDAVSLLLDGTTEWRKTFARANLKNELDLFDVMEVNPAIIRRLRDEYLKFGCCAEFDFSLWFGLWRAECSK